MILHAPNDVAFNLLSVPIYWYGIIMAIAIFVAICLANVFFNKINPHLKKDIIIEYSPLIILMGIFCARLYFCVLNFNYYFSNPIEILDFRQGGLSIHGAIIGGIFAMYIIARKTKTPLMNIMDSLSCTTILGQAIGRWGNYFNSEAYGFPVKSQSWGVFIPYGKRISEFSNFSLFHPTFLYESILDFSAFFLLLFLLFKFGKKYTGITFFSYLTLYAIIRYFIEKIRVDSALNIGSLPVAEIVSILLLATGVSGILFVIYTKRKDRV